MHFAAGIPVWPDTVEMNSLTPPPLTVHGVDTKITTVQKYDRSKGIRLLQYKVTAAILNTIVDL